MARFVIGPDVALHLAAQRPALPPQHRLLAPTLLRSQVLAMLYAAVRRGELDERTAQRQLDQLRALRLRLLGDRVLQGLAWKLAAELGWTDTFVAEYLALTRLQADAFVCMDAGLASAVSGLVRTATLDEMLHGAS
jgi:hypothetical protein